MLTYRIHQSAVPPEWPDRLGEDLEASLRYHDFDLTRKIEFYEHETDVVLFQWRDAPTRTDGPMAVRTLTPPYGWTAGASKEIDLNEATLEQWSAYVDALVEDILKGSEHGPQLTLDPSEA